jgi:hypothetical protein
VTVPRETIELLSPVSGNVFAACAATFLWGDILVVGAGRMIAPQVLLMLPGTKTLTIVEKDPDIYKRALGSLNPQSPVIFHRDDAYTWDNKGLDFDGILFDIYPWPSTVREWASRYGQMVRGGGRFACLTNMLEAADLGPEWIDLVTVCPGKPHGGGQGIRVLGRL